MNRSDLSGKTAIVTGGTRGIGLACAEALAGRGANVVITSRTRESAEQVASSIEGTAAGFEAHVLDESAMASCMEFALDRFGSIDVLLNNAGTNPAFGPVVEQDAGRFMKTMEINVWAPARWTAAVWSAWMKDNGGVVINNASLGGMMVGPNLGVYHSSKAALLHLTRHLAFELAPRVRVNAVAPGVVQTRWTETIGREEAERIAAETPLGRLGSPSDIGGAVAFLASDDAAWVTGETLLVDGGQMITSPLT